jgi:hypothetical protein
MAFAETQSRPQIIEHEFIHHRKFVIGEETAFGETVKPGFPAVLTGFDWSFPRKQSVSLKSIGRSRAVIVFSVGLWFFSKVGEEILEIREDTFDGHDRHVINFNGLIENIMTLNTFK